MEYPITTPSTPGVYESAKLGDRAQLQINEQGQASTVVNRYGVEYTHPILNLAAWAAEYGPFRELDMGEPEPDPSDPESSAEAPSKAVEVLTGLIAEAYAETPATADETAEEAAA